MNRTLLEECSRVQGRTAPAQALREALAVEELPPLAYAQEDV